MQAETAEAYESYEPALHAPRRWGLSAEAVAHLGDRLSQFGLRFRGGFTTRTRDTSAHAYDYLRAQLTMDTERNFANMDRTLNGGDGQALPHFMSNSPWSGQGVFSQTDLPPSVFGYLLSNQLVKLFQTLWCRHVICPFYSCISPYLAIKWRNPSSSYLPMF